MKKIGVVLFSLILLLAVTVYAVPTTYNELIGFARGIIIGKSQTIQIEGATDDAYETILTVTDPTADRTITFPNSSGTVSLTATQADMAFEGATANDYETYIQVTDPTKDVFYEMTIPTDTACAATGTACALLSSTLATNAVGAANSIWGESAKLVFEGSTANASEASISAANVTADVNLVIPDAAAASYTIMVSTLATNAPLIANSVYGVSNGLHFTGATGGDTNEVFLTTADPGADYTVTLPAATGTVALTAGAGSNKTVTAGSGTTTLTAADCGKTYTAAADADGVFDLPAGVSGCTFTFINIGAATNNLLTINPDAADGIFGTVTLAASVVAIAGSNGDAVSNTKGTSIRGDSMTIRYAGTDWYILASTGIWADIN